MPWVPKTVHGGVIREIINAQFEVANPKDQRSETDMYEEVKTNNAADGARFIPKCKKQFVC